MAVYGVYRGICVDNRDPLSLGRVRVSVPQVLGSAASGWAFPSWGMDDLVTWPEDRLPKAGQGVWVLFEGADRLTWISAFGPQEFSEQHKENEEGYYGTTLEVDLPILPINVPVPIAGTMDSPAGIPWTTAVITFEKSPDKGTWTTIATSSVDQDGNWSVEYSRASGEDDWWYRAAYAGEPPYLPSTSVPEQILIPEDYSVISWNDPDPQWQRPIDIIGALLGGDEGFGVARARITLYFKIGSGPWFRGGFTTTDNFGSWRMSWTRTKEMTQPMEMRAVYLGSVKYDYSEVPVPPKVLPAVSVPVDITWVYPQITSTTTPVQFSGTINSAYGVPYPNPDVQLQARIPALQSSDEGVWTTVATTQVENSGNWSLTYLPTSASADYRAVFPGAGVFQPAMTEEVSFVFAMTTTTTSPAIPALFYGTSFLATGSVIDQLNRPVSVGNARLEFRRANGPNTSWGHTTGADSLGAMAANGTYSIPNTGPDLVGPVEYRVSYLANPVAGYLSSTSPPTATVIKLQIPILTQGAISHSSVAFSWVAIPGAELYEVSRQVGTGPWTFIDQAGTSYTYSGLATNNDYSYRVRAKRLDASGTYIYSAYSAVIKMNTGVGEVRNVGSFSTTRTPAATKSWRPLDGFGHPFGDQVIQGIFGASGSYQGLLTFDGLAFRNWVTANYGPGVVDNLVWNAAVMHMSRPNEGGSSGAVNLLWYVSSGIAGQAGPYSYAGGAWTSGLAWNTSGAITLPYAHWAGHILLNQFIGGTGVCSSFMFMHGATTSYTRFHGGNSCILEVTCSWNYVTVSDVAARWY